MIKIATRKSALAMWQAETCANLLRQHHPALEIELVGMSTTGDRFLNQPLVEIGGKGLFLKELEEAMLDGRADLAVHSLKDVPFALPEGLQLAAILERAEPHDALVGPYGSIAELPQHAIVGTASLRRASQLKAQRPDITVKPIRGNVQTRLNKLDNGDYDAIILAAVGLKRLELTHRIACTLPKDKFLPAVGQGVIAIECREDDQALKKLLHPLHCQTTHDCILAERAFNTTLGGSCHTPIAGHAVLTQNNEICLDGWLGSEDGQTRLSGQQVGPRSAATLIGTQLAEQLLEQGGRKLLQQ